MTGTYSGVGVHRLAAQPVSGFTRHTAVPFAFHETPTLRRPGSRNFVCVPAETRIFASIPLHEHHCVLREVAMITPRSDFNLSTVMPKN